MNNLYSQNPEISIEKCLMGACWVCGAYEAYGAYDAYNAHDA